MKKTVTFIKALAFVFTVGFLPASMIQAQNRDQTEISVKDLPKISMTLPMSNFNGLNIKTTALMAHLPEWLGTYSYHTFPLLKSENLIR